MAVDFQRKEYIEALPDWEMVDRLCEGESEVKKAGSALLPDPVVNTGESRQEIAQIYARYLQRALYTNVVGRTRSSLIGAVYRKDPVFKAPTNLQYMAEDCDGAGLSIIQQSQKSLEDVLTQGRCGLLVDYPTLNAPASVADMQSGMVRANIVHYDADQIINWQHTRIGGKNVLSLVVLSESQQQATGYSTNEIKQLRSLELDGGRYVVRIWRKPPERENYELHSEAFPTMANGQPWTVIPFCFIGSINNDSSVDPAPLYDLACVNRKHYQLAADWYNALYYAGQPQPVMTGLTEEWRDWLQEQGIVIGARAMLPLPVGGSFQYATVAADTAIQKELDTLMQSMVMLGARLVQNGEAVKTATQSAGEQDVAHSIVSLCASNVSDAYTVALQYAQMFMGGAGEVSFRLNTDLQVITWDAQTIAALVSAWQSGTMPKNDVIRYFQRIGLIDSEKPLEDVLDELETGGVNLG